MLDKKFRKPGKKKKKPFVVLSAFILLLVLVILFSNRAVDLTYRISFPMQRSLGSLGKSFGDFTALVGQKSELQEENRKLKDDKRRLISEIVLLGELKKENEILREALDAGIEREFNLVFAGAFGFNASEDIFVIDKGSGDGISEGMPVITQRRILVGMISEVYDNFSRVALITREGSPSFDAEIHGRETAGLIRGGGRFSLMMDFISKDDELIEGDAVVTMGEIFPRGLFVGSIIYIDRSDPEPFYKAEVIPYFNPAKLRNVFIITDRLQ